MRRGELLETALPVVAGVGAPVDARTNPDVHDDYEQRRALFESAGMGLFQEKQGHYWQASAAPMPVRSGRLTFRAYNEIPRHEFLAVLSQGPAGTLDRNDRYYYELTGPVGWAKVMEGFRGPGDKETWKVGYDAVEHARRLRVAVRLRRGRRPGPSPTSASSPSSAGTATPTTCSPRRPPMPCGAASPRSCPTRTSSTRR